jgi:hypothetical protein
MRERLFAGHVQGLGDVDPGRYFQLLEDLAALFVRAAAQVFAVQPEHVEDDHPLLAAPLLQELEARRAFGVENHHFAVDDELLRLHLVQCFVGAREAWREIELVAAEHRHLSVDDGGDGPEAVVLQLVPPVLFVVGRAVGERGQHRREELLQ